MSDPAAIASRHLLPIEGMQDVASVRAQSVQIVIHNEWATSIGGQLLASCLVNLLVRQTVMISGISIFSKKSISRIRLPSGPSGAPFPACLMELGHWAVGDAMPVATSSRFEQTDFTIFIGPPSEQAPSEAAGHQLAVVGEGWLAWIGKPSRTPRIVSSRSTNPLGPFLAAALAAGEIYKRVRGILRGQYLESNAFSLWSGQSSTNYFDVKNGPELSGHSLPPLHIVGIGAVGNGLAYAIANVGFRSPYIVLLDDDRYDRTNLNRCPLAGWRNLEEPKVRSVAGALDYCGVSNFPFDGSVRQYLEKPIQGLREDVAAATANLEFAVIASCVDKGISRHDVQGLHPRLLLGGSTLDLKAKANVYALWPGAACLGCHNYAERDGEKLRALERRLRDMPPSERRTFLEQRSLDARAIEEHLAEEKCGTLGEAALGDFASRSPTEFSVGFVSLGAALLLASALFRHTIFGDKNLRTVDMTTLNFLNGGFSDAGLSADDKCELKCGRSQAA